MKISRLQIKQIKDTRVQRLIILPGHYRGDSEFLPWDFLHFLLRGNLLTYWRSKNRNIESGCEQYIDYKSPLKLPTRLLKCTYSERPVPKGTFEDHLTEWIHTERKCNVRVWRMVYNTRHIVQKSTSEICSKRIRVTYCSKRIRVTSYCKRELFSLTWRRRRRRSSTYC